MPKICFNLVLDSPTEQAIRALWANIANVGNSVPRLTESRYRPHITLAVYDVKNIDKYEAILAPVASALAPFPVRLEALGIFPEEGVVFLAPRMSHTLFSLHDTVIELFASLPEDDKPSLVSDWYLPDIWVPHATLVGGLSSAYVLKGLKICLHHWIPLQGYVIGMGMRLFPETIDYRYYPFNG